MGSIIEGTELQLKKDVFLREYSENPNISAVCEHPEIDISRSTFYRWKNKDPMFTENVEAAEEKGIDGLEAEAYRRALEGSDTLLIFLLKNKRKKVYGDKLEVDATVKVPGKVEIVLTDMTPEDKKVITGGNND